MRWWSDLDSESRTVPPCAAQIVVFRSKQVRRLIVALDLRGARLHIRPGLVSQKLRKLETEHNFTTSTAPHQFPHFQLSSWPQANQPPAALERYMGRLIDVYAFKKLLLKFEGLVLCLGKGVGTRSR